jgi:uncharacterized membrane protein
MSGTPIGKIDLEPRASADLMARPEGQLQMSAPAAPMPPAEESISDQLGTRRVVLVGTIIVLIFFGFFWCLGGFCTTR